MYYRFIDDFGQPSSNAKVGRWCVNQSHVVIEAPYCVCKHIFAQEKTDTYIIKKNCSYLVNNMINGWNAQFLKYSRAQRLFYIFVSNFSK